eukprot:6202329-Pleurochrysis_carterae.AAC.2
MHALWFPRSLTSPTGVLTATHMYTRLATAYQSGNCCCRMSPDARTGNPQNHHFLKRAVSIKAETVLTTAALFCLYFAAAAIVNFFFAHCFIALLTGFIAFTIVSSLLPSPSPPPSSVLGQMFAVYDGRP